MTRLANDGTLKVLLARFHSLMKPPTEAFTKELPPDLESDPLLITFAMEMLIHVGYAYNESIPYDLMVLFHRALAIDFISAIKIDRPDVVDFFLQELYPEGRTTQTQVHHTPQEQNTTQTQAQHTPLERNTTQTQVHHTPPEKSTRQGQFHHYIPRFILKTFADNFSLDNGEFTTDTSSPDLSWLKGKPSKLRRKERPRYDINVYRVQDHSTRLNDVSRAYGTYNMYRDLTEADCMKFEKLLAKHECTSATFIRRIWNDDEDLLLTRSQLGDLKKFLAVMMYRSEHRRSQYFNQRFDVLTEISVRRHMEHNNISNAPTVWFENLKWIIKASVDDIVKEYHKAFTARVESMRPAARSSPYQGPIHVAELEDFGYLMTHTIACIWQAETGSEFILSEGCFGAWEGEPGIQFHHFFIVSPRFAIVLVNRLYLDERLKKKPRWTSMFGDNLHVFPETAYKKGAPSKPFDFSIHSAPDDVFTYQRIVVPKEDVYKVNAILLDDRRESLTYKSNVSMYKSLRYYDKVKNEMFHDCRDYTNLKRKLFSNLNRTHPAP
ncbi:hypothetical protein BGZ90_012119 [Linnemannia elongata]|nr:hypothetical protein BGZ90_012119 [Linnemannia elongata]